MSFKYAVIGAGRQGIAAAYDMAKFGDAGSVLLIDSDGKAAEAAARRLDDLPGRSVFNACEADAGDWERLEELLSGVDSMISAVPYSFNLALSELAVRIGANMCDLGGHTGIVREQLKLDEAARKAGITIVPDCGMGPGMNISLALYAMSLLDDPQEVYIWDGGLPLRPVPPWNYRLCFNIGGLTNEYYGNAFFIRDGKVTEVPCFDGYEKLDFAPPLGRLEAFVTSGGLSTAPWTFEGKLKRLENRTLRYPGHRDQFRAFGLLGLFNTKPIRVGDRKVIPRDVFHKLLEPRICAGDERDVCVIRVKCVGEKDGRRAESRVQLTDHYDGQTGFCAMQRLTGWHASIMAILAAKGKLPRGAVPVEKAASGETIVKEARKRGFVLEEEITVT